MKIAVSILSALCIAAAGLSSGAEVPVPVFTGQEKDVSKVAGLLNKGEVASSFFVRFSSLPSVERPGGLFTVEADEEGYVYLRLNSAPTAIEGGVYLKSKMRVAKGEWHHIAFSYSLIQQRVAFYIDGYLQFENDNIFIPELDFNELDPEEKYSSKNVRDFRIYDIALTSDYLLPARNAEARAKAAVESVEASAAKSQALRPWAENVKQRAARAVKGEPTAKEIADLERDAGSMRALETSRAFGPVVFQQVKPYESKMILPYVVPDCVISDGTIRTAAARGQNEVVSFVVTALAGVRDFTVKPSDLRCGNSVIQASAIDIKLLKRWYRAGGAWVSYFLDPRLRILTPHLLVNDDELIRVDELRTRNYMRLDYPEGRRYVDFSNPKTGHHVFKAGVPFRDADTLQPTKQLWEAGRNQQYFATIAIPENAADGVYTGTLDLIADNRKVGSVEVKLRVFPFTLPRPASYENPDQVYFGHLNYFPKSITVATQKEAQDWAFEVLKNIADHGMNHAAGAFDNPTRAKLALKAGIVPDYIFGVVRPDNWRTYFEGVPAAELTSEDRDIGLRMAVRKMLPYKRYFEEVAPGAKPMVLFYSESSAFSALSVGQAEQAEAAHRLGWDVFAHGSTANLQFAGDIQDSQSDTSVSRDLADAWHAAGATVMVYAQPFPGPENPALERRRNGLERWKRARYDGNMLHGFDVSRIGYNEFAYDPGGDGNYRCVETAFHSAGRLIYTLPWEGVKAAYEDVRYGTLLKNTASRYLTSEDEDIRREAKRALIWLEQRDGDNVDMSMFRAAVAERTLVLMELAAKKGLK